MFSILLVAPQVNSCHYYHIRQNTDNKLVKKLFFLHFFKHNLASDLFIGTLESLFLLLRRRLRNPLLAADSWLYFYCRLRLCSSISALHCYRTGSQTSCACRSTSDKWHKAVFLKSKAKIMGELPQKQIQKSLEFFNDTSIFAVSCCSLK